VSVKPGLVAGVVLANVAAGGSATAQALRFDRERVLAFDMRVERFSPRRSPETGGPGVAWVVNLPPLARTVSRIRLHFKVLTAGDPASWQVRVKDLGVATLQTIPGTEATAGGAAFWTDELGAGQVKVELSWNGQGEQPVLEADRYAYGLGLATPLSIVGLDQRRPIATAAARYKALAPPVARLRIMTDDGQAFCTGFLLGERLLMTNEHCVRTAEEASSLLVDFRYDAPAATPEVVRGATLLRTSAGLDYTLLRLSKPVETTFGRLHLETASPVHERQELVVIQHPGGEPKQVSLEGCLVAGVQREGASTERTDFGHECDTLGGSSGSPVLDRATGRVVGLHHFGFHEGLDEPVNQAVEIGRILDDLSTQVDPDVFDEVRQAPPP
jgi:V8-like Glu-specific endopeptidase